MENGRGHKYGVLLPSFMQREGRGCCGFKTEKVVNRRNSALGETLRESSRHHGGTLRYQRRQREPSWERAILEGPCNPGGHPECEAVFMIIPRVSKVSYKTALKLHEGSRKKEEDVSG